MKKLLIAMLVLTFILATTVVALAGTGRFGTAQDGSLGSNYIDRAQLGDAYKDTDGAGPDTGDPHGGYSAATNVCSFCHAVHNAGTDRNGTNVFKLTRTSATGGILGACEYCHVSGTQSAKQPYEWPVGPTKLAEHTLEATVIPDAANNARLGTNGELDCKDCHEAAPHAANEIGAGKLISATRTSVTGLCASCHTKNNVGAAFNQQSHPMVEDSDGGGNGRAAAGIAAVDPELVGAARVDTNDCRNCHAHKKADGSPAAGLFPHQSSAARFLNEKAGDLSADGSTGTLDAICLDCHQWSSNNSGVSKTF